VYLLYFISKQRVITNATHNHILSIMMLMHHYS